MLAMGTATLALCATANAGLINFPDQQTFLPVKAVTINPPLIPIAHSQIPLKDQTNLTLQDAILIALQHNSTLQTSLNNRQLQHFDLLTAKQAFEPTFTLTNSLGMSKTNNNSGQKTISRTATVNPSMTWKFPLGTSITTSDNFNPSSLSGSSQNKTLSNEYSISVTQPLLQGFGVKVNEVALDNAYDTQTIDDIALRTTVQTTVTTITNDFYAVVNAKQNYQIAKTSLKSAQLTLRDRKAKLKAGQIPKTDVNQAALDLITQQQSLQSAKIGFATAKAALLDSLGLPADTRFVVDDKVNVEHLQPNMNKAIKQALKNNLTIKTAELNAKIANRNILTEENNRLWKLNLVLTRDRTRRNINYPTSDTNSIQDDTSAELNLTIKLNRVNLDKAKLTAAINQQNDELTEAQTKRTVVNNVEAAVNNLNNLWVQLSVSKQKLALTQSATKAAEIQYQYGKLDAFTLNQQKNNLVTAQQGLINAQIAYVKQVQAYRVLVGTLLTHRNIHVEAHHHG